MDAPESVVISRLESPKTPEEVLEAISSLRELAGLQ
jgi:xanthine dehydrogenase molybdopterin-binding subunit B